MYYHRPLLIMDCHCIFQQTWTSSQRFKWLMRRSLAGVVALRESAVLMSCLHRHKLTFVLSRISCRCQVKIHILCKSLSYTITQPTDMLRNIKKIYIFSVKWVGVGKSRESMIKLFWWGQRERLNFIWWSASTSIITTIGGSDLSFMHQRWD